MIDCVVNEWVGNDETEVLGQKETEKESDENGQAEWEGREWRWARHMHEHELGSKVGLGRAWACVREERRRDRDRMVRLALSPLHPRFPLLHVSCHAFPSCCRLPPAVPGCANGPLGGQRGDYDGAALADLGYVPNRWALTGWLRPVLSARAKIEQTQAHCRSSSLSALSLLLA